MKADSSATSANLSFLRRGPLADIAGNGVSSKCPAKYSTAGPQVSILKSTTERKKPTPTKLTKENLAALQKAMAEP